MSVFQFNPRKATQAAAVILKELPRQQTGYYLLLKLLYMADRASLRDTGAPITGARPVAMRGGPLPIEVYECITGRNRACGFWNTHIHKDGYTMTVVDDPGTDRLCPYEMGVLKQLAQKFGPMHPAAVGKITHHYAEYKKHEVEKGRKFIPIRDVLDAVGRGEQAKEIIQEARDRAAIQRLFGGGRQ